MPVELRKFVASEIIYGRGAMERLGQCASAFGVRKALLVTDPGVIAAGWADLAIKSLQERSIDAILWSRVTQNPRVEEVMAGAEAFLAEACDMIVAVGGGSPMDCAKGIGIVASNGGSILDYEGVDKIEAPAPPLICLPTTSGTAADVSQFAVISDRKRKAKVIIVSKSLVPDISVIDPCATLTMDDALTACTGFDAMVHAIEAYVSNAHSELTDIYALKAIENIASTLVDTIKRPDDIECRERMAMGSLEAGLAFSNASLGAVHALSHGLGGLLDLPHGECNAIMLEPVVRYNFPAAPERYRDVAKAMGLATEGMNDERCLDALTSEIRRIKEQSGITRTLRACGVKREHLPSLAAYAMTDACMVTNPRRPVLSELEALYGEAF